MTTFKALQRISRVSSMFVVLAVSAIVSLATVGVCASPAVAAEPWWHLDSGSEPTNIPPEGKGQIVVTATDLGDANANGAVSPVLITDTLPHGLRATGIEGRNVEDGDEVGNWGTPSCSLATLSCEYTGIVPDYVQVQIVIYVEAQSGAHSGEVNHASVSGGGALGVSVARAVTISSAPTPYGVEAYEMTPEEEGGAPDTQAGSHPFQLTTTLDLNQTPVPGEPPALAKDFYFNLPPGLIGNPTPFPQCPETQFLGRFEEGTDFNKCPAKTAVGIAAFTINIGVFGPLDLQPIVVPLFNLVPNVGEPARFGFYYDQTPVYLDTSVRTGGDYGVTVSVNNITQGAVFVSSRVTFWGVPGDSRHNNDRGWGCIDDERFRYYTNYKSILPCTPLGEAHPPPLLVLPTSCTGPLQTTEQTESWKDEGVFYSASPVEPLPALDGCNRLPFTPSIGVVPDGQDAASPSGLSVKVHVPQSVDLASEGLSEADVRNTTVTLPVGVHISTSAADGLLACSEELVGLHNDAEPACPEASKIATVEIKTPLLPNPLVGEVYLAAQ